MPSSDMLDFIGPIEAGFRMAQQAGQFRLQQQRQQQEAAEQRQIMGQRAAQMQVAQQKLAKQLEYEAQMDDFKKSVGEDVSELTKKSLLQSSVMGVPEFPPQVIQQMAFQKNLHKLPAEEIIKIMPQEQRAQLAEQRLTDYVKRWQNEQDTKREGFQAAMDRKQAELKAMADRVATQQKNANERNAARIKAKTTTGLKDSEITKLEQTKWAYQSKAAAAKTQDEKNRFLKNAREAMERIEKDKRIKEEAAAKAEASVSTNPDDEEFGAGQVVPGKTPADTTPSVDPNDPLGILKK